MKIEQQMFRDQLAVELVKLLAQNVTDYGAKDVVHTSFELADLTCERIVNDLNALNKASEAQATETALREAELLAEKRKAERQLNDNDQATREFFERRSGGGINVTETDDLHEVLDILRSVMGRN